MEQATCLGHNHTDPHGGSPQPGALGAGLLPAAGPVDPPPNNDPTSRKALRSGRVYVYDLPPTVKLRDTTLPNCRAGQSSEGAKDSGQRLGEGAKDSGQRLGEGAKYSGQAAGRLTAALLCRS